MKKIHEYKVSENIINKRIKELAFNIAKYFLLNINIYEPNDELHLQVYYIYDEDKLYTNYNEVKDILNPEKDLIVDFKSMEKLDNGEVFNGVFSNYKNSKYQHIVINHYQLLKNTKEETNNKLDYKQTYTKSLYRTTFHELIHYFSELENINKTSNKYLNNLKLADKNTVEIIELLTVHIDKEIVYYLSDEEIRANTINFYIFGRCKANMYDTIIYKYYENIGNLLNNGLTNIYNNINVMVDNNAVTNNILNKIKSLFNDIKNNQITDDFDKLLYYGKIKNKKSMKYYLKKIFKKYWVMLTIQLDKAYFTFEQYYKMGLRNEKFK
jgi:hypothetical protein